MLSGKQAIMKQIGQACLPVYQWKKALVDGEGQKGAPRPQRQQK